MGVHANRIECMQVGMRDGGIFCPHPIGGFPILKRKEMACEHA